MKNYFFLFCFVSFLACNSQKSPEKINLKAKKMQEGREYGNQESLQVRCDCTPDSYNTAIQQDIQFAKDEGAIFNALMDVFKKPADSLPSSQWIHNRILAHLNKYQNHSARQMLYNWAGYGFVKVYFLRKNQLSNEDKQILEYYMNLLVAEKNTNLPELADALELLEGYWQKSKVRETAQQILTNYDGYNTDGYLNLGNQNNLPNFPDSLSFIKDEIEQLAIIDDQAKQKINRIIDRNL